MQQTQKTRSSFKALTGNRVLYRGVKKKKVPLVATPFADNLADCLVFLDEAHCRGTDLKLPQDAKGALTLALGQTKDQTVQGKYPGLSSIAINSNKMQLR